MSQGVGDSGSHDARPFAINTALTSLYRALGVASGLLLDVLVVSSFGLGAETDAYFAAAAVPTLIASTLEAQLPKVLVPFFANNFENSEKSETWARVYAMLLSATLIGGLVAALLSILAPVTVPLQAPGLVGSARLAATDLHRTLLWLVPASAGSAVLSGALLANNRYGAATTGRLTTNLVSVAVVVMGYRHWGLRSLAIGLVAGTVVQGLVLLFSARLTGLRLLSAPRQGADMLHVLRLSMYSVGTQAVGEGRTFLENFIGSYFPAGALSAVRYANRITASLAGVMIGGVVTTSLPVFSMHVAAGRLREWREAVLRSIKYVALIACPIVVWLTICGDLLASAAFERGRFTSSDSATIGWLLALSAPYLLCSRVVGVLEAAYYSRSDLRPPLYATAGFLVGYALACLFLLPLLGTAAFAAAVSASSLVTMLVLVAMFEREYGALPWRDNAASWRALGVAVIAMAGVSLVMRYSTSDQDGEWLARTVRMAVVSGGGFAAFATCAVLLKVVDLNVILRPSARP